MTIDELRENVVACANEVFFEYNGKKCGVEPTVKSGVFTFEAWCGKASKTYFSFTALLNDKFFDGKTIVELLDQVEFHFC